MIIVMKQGAAQPDIEAVVKRVEELGKKVHLSRGEALTIIGVIAPMNTWSTKPTLKSWMASRRPCV